MAFRLEGSLHLEALEHRLARVVQRHEVLRTSFSIQGRYPVQVIAPDFVIGVPVIDLYSLSATERDRQVKQLARADALHPFDLSSGPLLRVHLLRLDIGQEHVLLFTLHHIISDGEWSMGILVRELSLLYEAELQAKPAPLPALPLQYADYAIWQR